MKLIDNNDPYFSKIAEYIYRQFPDVAQPTSCETLEILTTILTGTKDVRYGPIPSPESLVTIRNTIRESMSTNSAIPVLVPWGSMKVGGDNYLDIAEVSAINRLVYTNNLVKKFYQPGLDIVIRVEDLSGIELFSFDYDEKEIANKIAEYCESFVDLVNILSKGLIRVSRESLMVNSAKFIGMQEIFLPLLEDYIKTSEPYMLYAPEKAKTLRTYENLKAIGWKGTISYEQRQHYYESYRRNYPDSTLEKHQKRLALYLAQSLTRAKLNMSGRQDYWPSFIQITFVQPIKGLPEGYHNNCLYYRTVPASQARTHICPWRAVGYLKIDNEQVCAKITTPHDEIQLESCLVELNENGTSVKINVKYYAD